MGRPTLLLSPLSTSATVTSLIKEFTPSKKFLRSTLFCFLVATLSAVTQDAWGASTRATTRGKAYSPDQISTVTVVIKEGQKQLAFPIQCFGKTPGQGRELKNSKVRFTTFAVLQRSTQNKKLIARFKALLTAGKRACSNSEIPKTPGVPDEPLPPGGTPVTPTPTPTLVPSQLSLEAYGGPFTEKEARYLYTRFGFGGTQAEIQSAVQLGLEGTVTKLLTYVAEPYLDEQVADIERDTWLTGDPDAGNENKPIDPNKPNELSRSGLRLGWFFRIINTTNPFFERLKFFIHDERLSVAASAAKDCELHSLRTYLNDLKTAAVSGDYKGYMRAMNNSQLMHLRWLDGASNLGGFAKNRPNENWAREFFELGTLGPTGLDGKPLYNDLDVAQSSIAFTGWSIDQVTIGNTTLCLGSKVPLLHTPGIKTIFNGTPWQASVENDEDVLKATFLHPATAQGIAKDIWREFINKSPTPDSIETLAQVIRANDYNLLPMFRKVMLSKALWDPLSKGTLVKHPLERVAGFLRVSGFPLNYRQSDQLLSRLEQRLFEPNTVFGWDNEKLAGDSLMLEWRNVVADYFVNIDLKKVRDKYGWSYYDRFVRDLNATGKTSTTDIATRVANDLGVTLNAAQLQEIAAYMNYDLNSYNCPQECGGQPFRLDRALYDTSPDSTESAFNYNSQRKIRGLVAGFILLSRDYFVK